MGFTQLNCSPMGFQPGSVLLEGVHDVRPFGGRKILYIWEIIERDMKLTLTGTTEYFPVAAATYLAPMMRARCWCAFKITQPCALNFTQAL